MAMTLTDMQTALQTHGFTDMDTATQNLIINDAIADICSREPWPFMVKSATGTFTAAQAYFTLPADFNSSISLVNVTTGDVLIPLRTDEANKRYPDMLTQAGPPMYYWFEGVATSSMKLWPVPSAADTYLLKYYANPTDLSSGSDVPLIPAQHRWAIVLGALVSAYDMEDDSDLASRFESKFEKRIQMMRESLLMQQWDRPEMMNSIIDGWDYMWD